MRSTAAACLAGAFAAAAGTTTAPAAAQGNPAPTPPVFAAEAREIAIEAYTYAYPIVLMELTRRVGVNIEVASPGGRTPMNQFSQRPAFPDASFTNVVRPNADTLYSILWFDVAKEPLVIGLPDSGGRYYLLQMLDMWSDTFAVPGSRTTGDKAQLVVLAGPGWQGPLPAGAMLIRSPTALGWIVGRTQTNGVADYPNVHRFQAGMSAVPLSQFGKPYTPPRGMVDPNWDMKTPPVEAVEKMDAAEFFALFAELMKANPPHANDYPVVHRMARIGIEPGKSFSLASASPEARQALEAAAAAAMQLIKQGLTRVGVRQNGWRTNLSNIGTYGTDYRARAGIAFGGLGANPVEDAIYPSAFADADGKPFSSDNRYVLRFSREQIPPARAFWSLTMYDQRQFFAANAINRFAIGDRDKLKFNADGSLDLYIQRASPGAEKESNWLPAPASGPFTMNLRLYWPKPEALDGSWAPPPVRRVE
jgi:hypothetical protein